LTGLFEARADGPSDRLARPGHQGQILTPIAPPCTPRVRSSGTFVRLPASETLHESGPVGAIGGLTVALIFAFVPKTREKPSSPLAELGALKRKQVWLKRGRQGLSSASHRRQPRLEIGRRARSSSAVATIEVGRLSTYYYDLSVGHGDLVPNLQDRGR